MLNEYRKLLIFIFLLIQTYPVIRIFSDYVCSIFKSFSCTVFPNIEVFITRFTSDRFLKPFMFIRCMIWNLASQSFILLIFQLERLITVLPNQEVFSILIPLPLQKVLLDPHLFHNVHQHY